MVSSRWVKCTERPVMRDAGTQMDLNPDDTERRISRVRRDWRLSPYVTVLPESELPAEYGLRADNESGRSRSPAFDTGHCNRPTASSSASARSSAWCHLL